MRDLDLTMPNVSLSTKISRTLSNEILALEPIPAVMIAAISTKGSLSTIDADTIFTLSTREGNLALVTERLFTLDAIEGICALTAERFVALVTHERSFAIKAERLFTLIAIERIFALKTERLVAHIADKQILACKSECLVALVTRQIIGFAHDAERFLAFFAMGKICALKAAVFRVAVVTHDLRVVITLAAECIRAVTAMPQRVFTIKTIWIFALFTDEHILAVMAKCIVALNALEPIDIAIAAVV